MSATGEPWRPTGGFEEMPVLEGPSIARTWSCAAQPVVCRTIVEPQLDLERLHGSFVAQVYQRERGHLLSTTDGREPVEHCHTALVGESSKSYVSVLSCRLPDSVATLIVTYPMALSASCEPIAERLSESFLQAHEPASA